MRWLALCLFSVLTHSWLASKMMAWVLDFWLSGCSGGLQSCCIWPVTLWSILLACMCSQERDAILSLDDSTVFQLSPEADPRVSVTSPFSTPGRQVIPPSATRSACPSGVPHGWRSVQCWSHAGTGLSSWVSVRPSLCVTTHFDLYSSIQHENWGKLTLPLMLPSLSLTPPLRPVGQGSASRSQEQVLLFTALTSLPSPSDLFPISPRQKKKLAFLWFPQH